ncbi:MAG TPA: S8 family serine peptidase, partial [Hanamia sp.]|nr:S8 family serine peptidase [Hanamia sp.]
MIKASKRFILGMVMMVSVPLATFAQLDTDAKIQAPARVAPHDWHQLDRSETGYYGISLNKAYDLLKGKKSKTVVVAVIDSGIDTLQEDLKPVLWKNPGEIPGNGIDDDHNGYIDDVFGWNFIGGKDGRNVKQDSYEAARVYWKLKDKFGDNIPDTNTLKGDEKNEAITFLKAKEKVLGGIDPTEMLMMQRILPVLERGDSIIAKDLGKTEFDGNDLKAYNPTQRDATVARMLYLDLSKANDNYEISNQDILGYYRGQVRKAEAANTPPQDFRGEIVQDNYNDINDRYYGNNDVMTGTPTHGTHCSGIIGAARNNGKGMNGIADNVKIMMVR